MTKNTPHVLQQPKTVKNTDQLNPLNALLCKDQQAQSNPLSRTGKLAPSSRLTNV